MYENLTPSKVLKGMAFILFSLYLTILVDMYMLNSIWSNLLIFGAFLAVSGISSYIIGRLFKFIRLSGRVLLAVDVAMFILIGYWESFFPPAQEVFISLVAETAGEICLCDVVVDGQNIPISQVEIVDNSGWLYRGEYDNFMTWPEEDGTENHLTMRFIATEVHLGFPYTP